MNFHTSTSANMPIKLALCDDVLGDIKKTKRIKPVHLQIAITNRCNLNCAFCCFRGREKNLEIPSDELKKIITQFKKWGTRAVTVTGGGEPLAHPQINEFLLFCAAQKIKVGLVTNGLLLENLTPEAARAITWCRISLSDEKSDADFDALEAVISKVVPRFDFIDWSLSYVILKKQNPAAQKRALSMREKYGFLNIRFTPNQADLNVSSAPACVDAMGEDEKAGGACVVETKPVERNVRECWQYLLKPFLGADGFIYPCCTIHYNFAGRDLPPEARVCHWADFGARIEKGGALCVNCGVCFSNHYNVFLKNAVEGVRHIEWV